MEKACSSPTRFAETMARRKAVFRDSHRRSAREMGSKGEDDSALSTRERSHAGILGDREGRSLNAPLRNIATNR